MIDTFLNLKHLAKKDRTGLSKARVAILGDCSTQHLALAIQGAGTRSGFDIEVFDADYDQIELQILDPLSTLYSFSPDIIIIWMCTQKLYERFLNTPLKERSSFSERECTHIQHSLDFVLQNSSAYVLQTNFPEYDDRIFGDFANQVTQSFIYQLRTLNVKLMELVSGFSSISILDLSLIQNMLGKEAFIDPKLYMSSKIACTLDAVALFANKVVDVLSVKRGCLKKCVVADLDNTLWGGVVGDDGIGGIEIGELGQGAAYSALQSWLKELKNRGVILAVCSKNEEETAKESFLKHPEMVLHLDDFALFVANWDNKAKNIEMIATELNLGLDSFVFLDDSPFERDSVKTLLPQVCVPNLPEDVSLWLPYLQDLDLFCTLSYSDEDAARTDLYIQERARKEARSSFANFEEYLESLDMKSKVAYFDEFHIPRISQLSQRSNQFNFTTIRLTEAEVEAIVNSETSFGLYFTLSDVFGDNGLISYVVLDKQDDVTYKLSNWVMSCRVLKRGMEQFVMNTCVFYLKEKGAKILLATYSPTKKNTMVKDLLPSLGFTGKSGYYSLLLEDYDYFPVAIKEA